MEPQIKVERIDSCRTLPQADAITAAQLGQQRFLHSSARPQPMGNLPDVLMGQSKVTRNTRNYPSSARDGSEYGLQRCRIHGVYQLSERELYAEPRIDVNTKMRIRLNPKDRRDLGKVFRLARLEAGFNQTELGQMFGGSQGAVSRWERGVDLPPVAAIRELANHICADSRNSLLDAAGLEEDPEELLQIKSDTRRIPLLTDPDQFGDPKAKMESYLTLPSEWLSQDANIKAARFNSNISPLFSGELIALVDTRFRDPDRLAGCIVVARTPTGTEPMTLRKDGGTYFLVPLGLDGDRAVRVLHADGEWSIAGKVVKWIGDAAGSKKRENS